MADLSIDLAGIRSPNPFWLASGPPSNTGAQVQRAFDHGWGGAVWKTLGRPIENTSSRYGGMGFGGERLVGLNNIELITDRPLETNLREIYETKKKFPKHAVIASLMVETREEWRDLVKRSIDAGADGLELNFGCPHGMCERGMGSAVGQEPKVLEELTRWVIEVSTIPVLVKLTPNISDINDPAEAAVRGGAHGISLINTLKSVIGVDLDRLVPLPNVGGRSTNGGYCGPAVKPIALHMVGQLARNPAVGVPLSGIGGISTWRDAAEFIALGATGVQVCTAVMHKGFRIVEDMCDGLSNWLDERGMKSVNELRGAAVPKLGEWGDLDLGYRVVARVDEAKCIGCDLCYVACRDGSHDCIRLERGGGTLRAERIPRVDEEACVGCNLCALVCPVPGCITMTEVESGKPHETYHEKAARGAGA